MPIWLRKFTVNQIIEYNKKEKEEINKTQNSNNSTSADIGEALPDHMKKIFQDQSKKSSYTTQRAKK
jgi:hypothetical protein|tara:strand:- start:10483 stop:10683 length:201 start_codon:yes stop_codon:yes gene_type:complete